MARAPFRLTSSVLLLVLLILSGCSEDNPAEADGDDLFSGAGMAARVDGEAWQARIAFATRTTSVGQILAVSGSEGTTTIAFAFLVTAGQETYVIGENGTNAIVTVGSVNWNAPAGGTAQNPDGTSGRINITTMNDERVAGTFEFVVGRIGAGDGETLAVTEGVFDLEYTDAGDTNR